MEHNDAIDPKLTAFSAIDKLRFLVDAREQAEAYAKRLVDDTRISQDIRIRLNSIDSTYLPQLRDAESKITDVQLATQKYVIASETLVSSILSTPTYRQRLKEEVRKVRESEVEDNPRSLLASYRQILADHLSDAGKALEKYDAAQKEAQKILDNISGIIQPLKQDVEEEKRRSKDKESLLIAGTVATSVACGGAGVGLAAAGLAITCPPAAAAVLAVLGIAAADFSIPAMVAAAGTVATAILSGELWKRLYLRKQQTRIYGEALDHMQVSRAETERTHADKRSLERALDNEHYDTEGFVLPALELLWDTARKHNSPGEDVTADSAE